MNKNITIRPLAYRRTPEERYEATGKTARGVHIRVRIDPPAAKYESEYCAIIEGINEEGMKSVLYAPNYNCIKACVDMFRQEN